MKEFNQEKNAVELNKLLDAIELAKNYLLFSLIYKVELEFSINSAILEFVDKEPYKSTYKMGATYEEELKVQKLNVALRDDPKKDFEKLFVETEKTSENLGIYDSLVKAIEDFPNEYTKNVIVAIVLEKRRNIGFAKVENLDLLAKKNVKLIVIYKEDCLSSEFMEFLEAGGGKLLKLDDFEDIMEALEEVSQIINREDIISFY